MHDENKGFESIHLEIDPVVVRAEPQGLDGQAGMGLEPGTAPGETSEWGWESPGPPTPGEECVSAPHLLGGAWAPAMFVL